MSKSSEKATILTEKIQELVYIKGVHVKKDGTYKINYKDSTTANQKKIMEEYAKEISDELDSNNEVLDQSLLNIKNKYDAQVTWEKPDLGIVEE